MVIGVNPCVAYDNDDLLTSAGVMTIARDPATGFVTGGTLGGVVESRTYNAYGEEQTYTASAGGAALYSVDYGTRDALGRIVTKTETVQGETHVYAYAYDSRGRLTDVTTGGTPTSHYEYDANGNRLVGPGLSQSIDSRIRHGKSGRAERRQGVAAHREVIA